MRSGGLCVALTPESVDDVFTPNVDGADLIEVRLDYLKDPQQANHVRWDRLPLPVIATCRGARFGGKFQGSLEEECTILETAARNGARYVDIDYRHVRLFGAAEVIASYHNFEQTPENLESILEQASKTSAHIVKVAAQVNCWSDNRRLLELMAKPRSKPVIVAGMGDMGQITRIAGPSRGSFLSYASIDLPGRQSAPGQVSLYEMLHDYKFRRVRNSTTLIGILGMPVGHSQSHILHNRAFEARGLDFAYMKFPANDLKDFFDNARQCGVGGFSVTIPHKIAVIPFMESITPEAKSIGAVNTVSICKEPSAGWIGDNTDAYGVRMALNSVGFDPNGRKIAIMGRGGAAKAAVAALAGAKEVKVYSRAEIAEANHPECDLLVNATPVGMYPNVDASPINGAIQSDAVFDMVYNPPTTKLLQDAASQGKTIIRGTTMFAAQAARQFEIWTGQPAPAEVYRADWRTS
jgi:3-dehydroquinate dehydratase/shikimate dehydrogenase